MIKFIKRFMHAWQQAKIKENILKGQLDIAIENEDYKKAAELRDKIEKLSK